MQKIILLLSAITIIGCNSTKEKQLVTQSVSEEMTSEIINDTVPYEESVMLLGKANRKGLKMDAFKDWYQLGYESYQPDTEILDSLKPLMKDINISLFMGTWCEDSQREVPFFYKIVDVTDFDESNLSLIAVSEEKTTPSGFENRLDITNVPTLIIYKDDVELGRIVEYSIETLEKDILTILSGKEYKHAYAE